MSRKKEEVFLRDIKKTKRRFKLNLKINLEDQKWLYYSVIGSFFLLLLLNYIFPSYKVEKRPYEIKSGFLGVALTLFGTIFLINTLFFAKGGGLTLIFIWLISAGLCVILLYFGLPLLFGIHW